MPRTQRLTTLSHGWSSGVLSPAAQDQPDAQNAFTGAADILNFEIQRDGGLAGRPPFVRSRFSFDYPRYNAIAQGTSADGRTGGINRDDADGHLRIVDGEPVIGLDGVHALNPQPEITDDRKADFIGGSSSEDPTRKALYEVAIQPQDPDPDRTGPDSMRGVHFVVWHDVSLRQGSPGTTRIGGTTLTPTFMAQYREPQETMFTGRGRANIGDATNSFDELGWGVFAPGRVARDIIMPMRFQGNRRVRNIVEARIVVNPTNVNFADQPLQLNVGGVSAYTYDRLYGTPAGDEPEPDPGRAWIEPKPYRIISWVVGKVPYALVLTLTGAQAFHVGPEGVATGASRQLTATWYFTPRQLRELTWLNYGKGMLLFHRDFPYPLQLQIASQTQMTIGYMRLVNVPEVDIAQVPGATVSVTERTTVALPRAQTSQPGVQGGVGGQQAPPRIVTGHLPPREAVPEGPSAGRERVSADTGAIRPVPVVVRREVVVSEQRGVEGAPSLQAVAPRELFVDNSRSGKLTVSWAGTGATSYQLFIRTLATFQADDWSGITAIPVSQSGDDIEIERTALQDATALMPGTTYVLAVKAVLVIGMAAPVESDFSQAFSATVLHPAPAAPTGLSIMPSDTVEGEGTASWNAVAGVTGYVLQARQTGSQLWGTVATQAGLTYSFSGLIPEQGYDWRVRAIQTDAEDGTPSGVVSVTMPDLRPGVPATPAAAASTAADLQIIVTWTKDADADGYVVAHRPKDTDTWTEVSLEDVATWTHIGLTAGSTYEYRVKSTRAGARDSGWSGIVDAAAGLIVPAVPTFSLSISGQSINGSITAVTGATGYRYRVATSQAGLASATSVDLGASRTFALSVGYSQTRYVQVMAYRTGVGESAWSTSRSRSTGARPLPPRLPAQRLVYRLGARGEEDFSWGPSGSPHPSSWEVQRQTRSSASVPWPSSWLTVYTGTANRWVIPIPSPGPAPGTQRRARVRGKLSGYRDSLWTTSDPVTYR